MLYPGLNGMRFKLNPPKAGEEGVIYLMDLGQARRIFDARSYDYTFENWDGIWEFAELPGLEYGPLIGNSRGMMRWKETVYWYHPYNGGDGSNYFRHVVDPVTLARYNMKNGSEFILPDQPDPEGRIGPDIQWVPKYDGNRVEVRDVGHVYLIDQGKKRRIADMATYNALFGEGNPWQSVEKMDLDSDLDIAPGTCLAKGSDSDEIFMIDRGTKRHIVDNNAMMFYGFAGRNAIIVPQVIIDAVPSGVPFRLA